MCIATETKKPLSLRDIDGHPNGRVLWVDCNTCGAGQRPATTEKKFSRKTLGDFGWTRVQIAREVPRYAYGWLGMLPVCSACNAPGKPREIKIRSATGTKRQPCNGACLNGKVSCNCRCAGKCHGAGECLGGHE